MKSNYFYISIHLLFDLMLRYAKSNLILHYISVLWAYSLDIFWRYFVINKYEIILQEYDNITKITFVMFVKV